MNTTKLNEIITEYKKNFKYRWESEKYKWQAVKYFNDNWKSDTDSFSNMFIEATTKHDNLLQSGGYWGPRNMIKEYCDICSEDEVKYQFEKLFDESLDLKNRIIDFMNYFKSEDVIGKVNTVKNKNWKSNQDTRAVSVYLASKYPEKYYFYMSSIYDEIKIIFDFKPSKRFSDVDKLLKYYEFCDEIYKHVKHDTELIEMLSNVITDEEYNDKSFHILVQDILFFYMNYVKEQRHLNKKIDLCWYVGAFISNEDKTDEFIDEGIWINGYNDKYHDIVNSIKVGDRIAIKSAYTQKHNLPFDINGGTVSVMEIKAVGEVKRNHKDGRTIDVEWIKLSPSKKWYFYTRRNIIWKVKRTHDDSYYNDLLDFTFENKAQIFEDFLTDPFWADKYLIDDEENEPAQEVPTIIPYTKADFLNDVYISSAEYDKLYNLLKHKKNIILQGAPGVGKTFAAKRFAYSIMNEIDDNRVKCVQFHQSYSYEDFIEGFRPLENGGFELRNGVFKKFCDRASSDIEKDFFFIIDEINRGNMSKIFGELLMLIEADKRGSEHWLELVYSGKPFFVPENLHIIGMMNTADRSLAMIDYALRRRFSFYSMKPAFESDGFKKHAEQVKCELFHKAVEVIKNLNTVIIDDKSLGKGFEIGHSYFCTDKPENITDEIVKNIIAFEIIPTIEEYWFDNETKLDIERQKLEVLLGDDNGDL